ncbi:MAG: DUF2807 domain-containing protein [Alistipes sp.]|jgi:hypothetical protein|nr:DUF2807 domain-containing protein [Alistipes sp.]
MKNLFLALAAAIVLASAVFVARAAVSASEATSAAPQIGQTTIETHFEGQRITGVEASAAFDIVLVRSDRTRAVVEVHNSLAEYVRISRSGDGKVRIGLHDVNNRVWRNLNRLPERERVQRVTIYLPSLSTIRLSGACDLSSTDTFSGEDVDILLSGASEIDGLTISSPRVKLQCSGATEVSLNLPATRELAVVASGASEIDITARGLDYSKIGVSGASEVDLYGDGRQGDWTVSGASELSAERFVVRDLSITSSGASDAKVNATGTLNAKASGASTVRYAGRPETLNNLSSDKKDVRPLQ